MKDIFYTTLGDSCNASSVNLFADRKRSGTETEPLNGRVLFVPGIGGEFTFEPAGNSAVRDEATTALTMLGFTKAAVDKTLTALLKADPNLPLEDLIKRALKMM